MLCSTKREVASTSRLCHCAVSPRAVTVSLSSQSVRKKKKKKKRVCLEPVKTSLSGSCLAEETMPGGESG